MITEYENVINQLKERCTKQKRTIEDLHENKVPERNLCTNIVNFTLERHIDAHAALTSLDIFIDVFNFLFIFAEGEYRCRTCCQQHGAG